MGLVGWVLTSYLIMYSLSMPNSCVCCGRTKGKGDKKVSMFRFPADKEKRQKWLEALNLTEAEIGEHSRICSRHFLHGDPSNVPSLDIGKRFASPKKISTDRGMRALKRATRSPSLSFTTTKPKRSSTPSSSRASSVAATTLEAQQMKSQCLYPLENHCLVTIVYTNYRNKLMIKKVTLLGCLSRAT